MSSIDEKNKEIIHMNNINSNWEYRKFLTSNGNKIMNHNRLNSCLNRGIQNTIIMEEKKNNPPFLFKSITDRTIPFGYQTSDLKEAFIYKRITESSKIAPRIVKF
tara:strand:+ start:414 stop:728 length:315 start_codon:yes stop_codon:yes gene_type:complete